MEIKMNNIKTLGAKLDDMTDQLQVLEMQKGPHYMLGSQLNQRYEILLDQYEQSSGKPYKYRSH
jgi:hypothetical protein